MKPFSSRERLEQALTRINDPKGEGAKACLTVYTEAARAAADPADARAKAGVSLGPLDGVASRICSMSPASRRGLAPKSSPTRLGRRPPTRRWCGVCAPAVR
jgi:hypothetical protein